MEKVFAFAAIGLLTGAAARLFYPGRKVTHVMGTMLIGIIGAVVGGTISWSLWQTGDGEFLTGNLILSAVGAMLLIVLWAGVAYKRSLRGYGKTPL